VVVQEEAELSAPEDWHVARKFYAPRTADGFSRKIIKAYRRKERTQQYIQQLRNAAVAQNLEEELIFPDEACYRPGDHPATQRREKCQYVAQRRNNAAYRERRYRAPGSDDESNDDDSKDEGTCTTRQAVITYLEVILTSYSCSESGAGS
jgi:hypothetical protein